MTRIKICGVTSVSDALIAARLGADAIGLNFYGRSPRAVKVKDAAEIVRALPPFVEAVGVFVNAPGDEIRATCEACGIRTVQLHGDEPPELVEELTGQWRIIRAFRCGKRGLEGLAEYLAKCAELESTPAAVLVDSRSEDMYGGTGTAPPWDRIALEYQYDLWPPLVLAGGLTPGNVGEAIARVRPYAVDVASGVESAPGRKDAELVAAFVRAVRGATARGEGVRG